MKKLIMGLFLTLSIMAVAGEKYDYVEDRLELKYTTLTDSKKKVISTLSLTFNIFLTSSAIVFAISSYEVLSNFPQPPSPEKASTSIFT